MKAMVHSKMQIRDEKRREDDCEEENAGEKGHFVQWGNVVLVLTLLLFLPFLLVFFFFLFH